MWGVCVVSVVFLFLFLAVHLTRTDVSSLFIKVVFTLRIIGVLNRT